MRWTAVLAWMIVIFTLSTDYFSAARTESLAAPSMGFAIRKLAHWTEYFVLAVLLMRALSPQPSGAIAKRHMVWSVILAVLYAISDEWHQSFVVSRDAKATDVLIDMVGAVCGAWSWYWRNRQRI
jgi:VanZ family protein